MVYKRREDAQAYQRRWRSRPEVRLRRLAQQRLRRQDPGVRKSQRDGELRRRYGLSLAEYDILFESQDRKCAICRGGDFRDADWHVDHDHATGRVRGILCRHCNRMLGAALDRPDVLRRAVVYLGGE